MTEQKTILAKDLKKGDILKIDNPYGYGFQRVTLKEVTPLPKSMWLSPDGNRYKDIDKLYLSYEWKGMGFSESPLKSKKVVIFINK